MTSDEEILEIYREKNCLVSTLNNNRILVLMAKARAEERKKIIDNLREWLKKKTNNMKDESGDYAVGIYESDLQEKLDFLEEGRD